MKAKARDFDLNKVCRACLSEKGRLRDLFSTKIPKIMENLAALQVSRDDGLPSNICVTCYHTIIKIHNFKKKMERSNRVLSQYVKQLQQQQKQDQALLRKQKAIKDILDLAMCEAEIEQITNEDESNKGQSIVNSDDEEDIPLSERLAKINKKGISYSENGEIKLHVLSGDPPPLVPLKPNKVKGDNASLSANDSLTVWDQATILYNSGPPPLVPIKPKQTNVIEIHIQCHSCNEKFDSFKSLKEHKVTGCKNSLLKCNICRKSFKERKRLIGHLKGHMVAKDYHCKICGKRYPNPSTFQIHIRTHTGERPFKCHICDKGFIRWAGVVGHMKTHQAVKPFKCEVCGKGFKVASNLERHKVLHSDSLPFCCNYCGKTFSQLDNLQLHIRTYHTNERPYLCNECGKGFVSATRLNRHMWVHTGYKPYSCNLCNKAYSNSNDLRNHSRVHLGKLTEDDKPYACEVCKMRFYHPCRLSRHTKTHDRPYSCTICFKSFSSNVLLQKHMNAKKSKHDSIKDVEQPEAERESTVAELFLEYDPDPV